MAGRSPVFVCQAVWRGSAGRGAGGADAAQFRPALACADAPGGPGWTVARRACAAYPPLAGGAAGRLLADIPAVGRVDRHLGMRLSADPVRRRSGSAMDA